MAENHSTGFHMTNDVPRVLRQSFSFVRYAVARFWNDNLSQAAAALTYSTLLALVPLLVLTIAILSGFPAFDAARERMTEIFFDTLVPEVGAELEVYLSDFTANAANLTAIGVVALAITAILLLSSIEFTLNSIWRVERPRSIGVRILIYWTILTMGPLLLGVSFALTSDTLSNLMRWAQEGVVLENPDIAAPAFNTAVAVVAQSLAFTMLFTLVPARPVRFRDAAIGGVFSGIAFELLGWAFNSFLTAGSTYETIYGAVAIIPIFLFWLYASWTVIIIGAVFAASFPDWWKTGDAQAPGELSPADRLSIAVALLGALLRQARSGGALAEETLHEVAPLQSRDDVLERLRARGFVVTTEDSELCLARDLHTATLRDLAEELGLVLGARPEGREDGAPGNGALPGIERQTGSLPRILERLHDAEATVLDRTIADVIADEPDETLPPQMLQSVPRRPR